MASNGKPVVNLLDYGAGNVRSLRNAIKALGYEIEDIKTADEITRARIIVFPGVGIFGQAMQSLKSKGWFDALRAYILADRPFFGICIGMQSLFEGSDESPEEVGLGIIPGRVTKFDSRLDIKVPQIGWNGISPVRHSFALENTGVNDAVYFVHSFCALPSEANREWVLSVTDYGPTRYISMVQKGNVVATQFHPEKSGVAGLAILGAFLARGGIMSDPAVSTATSPAPVSWPDLDSFPRTQLVKRVIACLDVRTNDSGDLVVTKGDQYDVREAAVGEDGKREVRNLGKPVALCKRYYDDGADEVVFLNITSFRQGVIEDLPMLRVLELSSENVFVPLTVGGGIREYTDAEGKTWSALDVASRYFRAGADKVSIGSDAVYAAEEYLKNEGRKTGTSCIELISLHYGAQAVVVSIDPKRVYVHRPEDAPADATVVRLRVEQGERGPNGEEYCWWQATVKGGREVRDIDAVKLAQVSELLGAGEIMLNCIDMDGQGQGYDIPLVGAVQRAVSVPVIASSGAGRPEHFTEVFRTTDVSAALAAGIFHRNEVQLQEVKANMMKDGLPTRL